MENAKVARTFQGNSMTPVIVGAALALLALDSGPGISQPTTVKPAVVQGAKSDAQQDPDKMICKSEELTGSRFSKRVCMTRSDWDERTKQVEVFERRLNQTATPTGGGGMSGQ